MTRGIKDAIIIDTNYTTAICTCGYLYTFTSTRELKFKERLHKKFCSKPPPSEDFKEFSSTGTCKKAVKSQRQNVIDNANVDRRFYG